MRNKFTKFILIACLVFGIQIVSNAQCNFTDGIVQNPVGVFTPSCGGVVDTVSTCMFGGDFFLMDVIAGNEYTVSNCGGSFDSQITIYDEATQTFIAFNDDFGPSCPDVTASIYFVATFTGTVRVILNEFSCISNTTCSPMTVMCQLAPPPPPNDDCASALLNNLTIPGTITLNGTTAGSTDLSVGQSYGAAQSWESFTISDCANVTISTCGSTPVFTDMFIGISSGCPAEFPTNFIFSDAFDFTTCPDGNFTAFYSNLPAGTYYVPVIGDAPNNHDYVLNITTSSCIPPPPNDDCANVIPQNLSVPGNLVMNGTSAGSTDLSVNQSYGAPQAWEAFTITSCATVTISTCGSVPVFTDMFVGISSGCPAEFPTNFIFADNFDFITCVDGNFTATYGNLPAGTYYVPVIGQIPNNHDYILNIDAVPCGPPPVNDLCTDAIPVNCGDVVLGTTIDATSDAFAGDCNFVSPHRGVWYTITGTGDLITVDLTQGTLYDSELHIYEGVCDTLVCVTANDDFTGVASQVSFIGNPGTLYFILVNGFNNNTGDFQMNISCATPAPNNDCANVTPVNLTVPGNLTFTGSSVNSTDNSVNQSYGAPQVWEAFTIDNCANVTINTCGTVPVFTNMFTGISSGCPADFPGNFINATSFDFFTCPDGNFTAVYNNLAPGTYYVPIIGLAPDNHEYILNIDAQPTLAQPILVAQGPTEFCLGGSVAVDVSNSGPISDFVVNISGAGFMDEVSWTMSDSSGNIVALGGGYDFGTSNNISFTVSGGPYTFDVSTIGFFGDNDIAYSVTCLSTNTLLISDSLLGGLNDIIPNLDCIGFLDYTWNSTPGLNIYTGTSVIASPIQSSTYDVTATDPATGCFNSNSISITVNPLPVLQISPSAPAICINSSQSLDVSGASTYTWAPSPSLDNTVGSPVLAAPMVTETFYVTGTDSLNCSSTDSVTITVNQYEDATFDYGANMFCSNGSNPIPTITTPGGVFSVIGNMVVDSLSGEINIASSGIGMSDITYTTSGLITGCPSSLLIAVGIEQIGNPTFDYAGTAFCNGIGMLTPNLNDFALFSSTPAGLSIDTTNGAVNADLSAPGSYTITNTLAATTVCAAISYEQDITINAVPQMTIFGGGQGCTGDSISTIIHLTGTMPFDFEYMLSGQIQLVSAYSDTTYVLLTDSSVTYDLVQVWDANCHADAQGTVIATINPLPLVTVDPAGPICSNAAPITLTAQPAGGMFMNANVVGDLFTPALAGINTVDYMFTDSLGCTGTASTDILVNAAPNALINDPPVSSCEKAQPFQLNGSPAGGTFAGPGISTSGLFNPAVAGVGAANLSYTVSDSVGCSDTAFAVINVLASPIVTLGNLGSTCINYPPFALAGGTPAGGTYSGTGVSAGIFNPATAGVGNINVTYTVIGANGCSGNATNTVQVSPCTGIESYLGISDVQLFPNPAESSTNLLYYASSQTDVLIRIYTQDGKLVQELINKNAFGETNTKINLDNLSSGMYYVIISAEGQNINKKLIVK